MRMLLCAYGSWVIWHHQNAILAIRFQCVVHRADNVSVDRFESFDFLIDSSLVARFIGCFDVNAYDVVLLQRFDRSLTFARIIGVKISRGTFNFNTIPTDQCCQASQKIDSRNHCSFQPESRIERRELRCLS